MREMENVLSRGNCSTVASHYYEIPDEIAQPWSLQQLLTLEELCIYVDRSVGSAKDWWDKYYKAREEVLSGVRVRMGMVVAVG